MLNEKAVADQCVEREVVVEVERLSAQEIASASNVADVFPELAPSTSQQESDDETEVEEEPEEEAHGVTPPAADGDADYDKVCRSAARAVYEMGEVFGWNDRDEMAGFILREFPILLSQDVRRIVRTGFEAHAAEVAAIQAAGEGMPVVDPQAEADEYNQAFMDARNYIQQYAQLTDCQDFEELVWVIGLGFPVVTESDVLLMAEGYLAAVEQERRNPVPREE